MGIEPRSTGPKPSVLPLDHRGSCIQHRKSMGQYLGQLLGVLALCLLFLPEIQFEFSLDFRSRPLPPLFDSFVCHSVTFGAWSNIRWSFYDSVHEAERIQDVSPQCCVLTCRYKSFWAFESVASLTLGSTLELSPISPMLYLSDVDNITVVSLTLDSIMFTCNKWLALQQHCVSSFSTTDISISNISRTPGWKWSEFRPSDGFLQALHAV